MGKDTVVDAEQMLGKLTYLVAVTGCNEGKLTAYCGASVKIPQIFSIISHGFHVRIWASGNQAEFSESDNGKACLNLYIRLGRPETLLNTTLFLLPPATLLFTIPAARRVQDVQNMTVFEQKNIVQLVPSQQIQF